MTWNREEVIRLLNARVEDEPTPETGLICIVHFEDSRMRYEIWVSENGVFLAADSERPVQGLPFFEISIPCTVMRTLPRSGMPTGLGLFSGAPSSDTLCFSITRREDGEISLSGAWDGMALHYAARGSHGTAS